MVDFAKAEFDESLGKWVPATGRPGARVAEFDGEKWAETGTNPSPGAISRGITQGYEGTKGLLFEALPALAQSALGYDEAAQKNLLAYQERMKKLKESGLGSRVGMEDIKDVGSFLSFAGESVGEAIPSIATALVPGVGLGAAGASTLGRAAVSKAAGKVASTAAETAAKEVARREAAGIAVDAGMRAAIEKAALEAAPALIGRNWGQMAGLALGSAAQNMPETFAKIYTETGEMRPEVATLVGGLKSSLDILGPLQLIKKTRGIDFSEKLSDVLAGRLLKGMPGTAGAIGGLLESAALEGLTEGTQELLDQLAVATLADKSINWKDIAEASLKGAFGTAVPGAAAGFVGQRAKAREAAQLGEMRGEQQAEEQRQAELQERYALLGEEPPAGPNFQRDAVSLLRRSNPNVPFTDEGRVDLEAAEKYAEENLPPSQRKAYLKKMRKLDLEAQDQVFLYVKDQEAKKVAAEQEATRRGEARRAEEAQRASDADIIQRGNADTSLLRDPAFRQQFDEARQRETQRRTQERTERLADEEMLAGLGFGDFPSRATPLQLDQIAQMGPERAQQVAASLQREGTLYGAEEPTKLLQSERQVVEDLIREQPRNAPIPLDILQQRLADQGRDVTLAQARDILSQYVETRPPALRVVDEKTQYPAKPGKGIRGPINVPGDVRLVEEDGQFSKVGGRTEKAAPGERTTDVLDRVHNALVDMPEGTPVGKREIDNIVRGLGAEPLSSRGLSDLYRTLRQRGVLGQLTPRGYLVQRAEPIANIPEVEGPPPAPAARSASPGTEVSRPVTPLQGTLQNPPAGLTPQQYEAMRNRVIRMDPKKILTKKDLDAAGGPGVELTQQQAKDIWEALSSNGDVKRAGLGFRVNPEAELSTQFRDEGSPRTDRPTEVTGQELLDKGTRNKLYGLGYTREDINGMSVEEARGVAERREKKSPATKKAEKSILPEDWTVVPAVSKRMLTEKVKKNDILFKEAQALWDERPSLTQGVKNLLDMLTMETNRTSKEHAFALSFTDTPEGKFFDFFTTNNNSEIRINENSKLAWVLNTPYERIFFVHSHPSNVSFSRGDIESFGASAGEKISVVRGSKGFVAIMVKPDSLWGDAPYGSLAQKAAQAAYQVVKKYMFKNPVIEQGYQDGTFSADQLNLAYTRLLSLAVARLGLIHYADTAPLSDLDFIPNWREAIESITKSPVAKEIRAAVHTPYVPYGAKEALANGYQYLDEYNRLAKSFSEPGGIEKLLQGPANVAGRSAQAQRPGGVSRATPASARNEPSGTQASLKPTEKSIRPGKLPPKGWGISEVYDDKGNVTGERARSHYLWAINEGERQDYSVKFNTAKELNDYIRSGADLIVYRGVRQKENKAAGYFWTPDFSVAREIYAGLPNEDEDGGTVVAMLIPNETLAETTISEKEVPLSNIPEITAIKQNILAEEGFEFVIPPSMHGKRIRIKSENQDSLSEEIPRHLVDLISNPVRMPGQASAQKPGISAGAPTLTQSKAMSAISEFFPEVNSRELNLPKGNKDLAEFARKLNDDINRQVEMGEPATKPYDCR